MANNTTRDNSATWTLKRMRSKSTTKGDIDIDKR
jgi:hypothetical protein